MKYGIYYAYWEHEWQADYRKYIEKAASLGFDILEIAASPLPFYSDKQHLLDFVSLQGQPEDFGIPHLTELPAIIWKCKNLETLRMSNPAKFAEQRKLLEPLLA